MNTIDDIHAARSRPVIAADHAAQAIFLTMVTDPEIAEMARKAGSTYAETWPQLGEAAGERIHAADVVQLAAFVRAEPDAPAEALYRQARMLGIHKGPPNGWLQLPSHHRLAYETFRSSLMTLDRVFLEEARLRPPRPGPTPPRVAIEDTILEELDDPLAPVSWAKPRPAVQTPRKGGKAVGSRQSAVDKGKGGK